LFALLSFCGGEKMPTAQERFLAKEQLCSRCKKPTNRAAHAPCKPCQAICYQEKCKTPGYRERRAKYNRWWRADNREKLLAAIRRSNLKQKFGITVEQYDAMYAAQNGLCALCRQPETTFHWRGKIQRLALDHCHKTNTNRGLLCAHCNHALERIENDPDWGVKARAYIEKYESPSSSRKSRMPTRVSRFPAKDRGQKSLWPS
jgi:hypothetical protein